MRYFNLLRPRIVSAISYMLQSVEYSLSQFYRWFWLEDDFGRLKIKRLKPTPKSRLIALSGSLIYVGLLLLVVWLWSSWARDMTLPRLVLAVGVLTIAPFLLVHLILVVIVFGTYLIQKPLEWLKRRKTSQIFQNHQAKVVVVAGSYGKTSMKHILTAVIGTKLKVAATPGNYNTPAGIGRFARKLEGDEDLLVIEAGEYKLGDVEAICRLVGPDIGFITGVNEQHLARMKSVENVLKTVFELAEALPDGAPLYINSESPYLKDYITRTDLGYSQKGVDDIKISKLSTGLDGTKLSLKPAKGKVFQLTTPLMGLHQAGPIAAAAHLALNLGLKPSDITKGLADLEAHDRRLKPRQIDGVTVIDDSYNGNPDGFLAGIEFLDGLKNIKRIIYVTPGIIELGNFSGPTHFALGQRLADSKIEQIYLNSNPATKQLAAGLEDGQYKGEIIWQAEEDNFLENLSELTHKGDVVLLQNSPREKFFYL